MLQTCVVLLLLNLPNGVEDLLFLFGFFLIIIYEEINENVYFWITMVLEVLKSCSIESNDHSWNDVLVMIKINIERGVQFTGARCVRKKPIL